MDCAATSDCPRNEQECRAGTCVSHNEAHADDTWFSCEDGFRDCKNGDAWGCNILAPGYALAEACSAGCSAGMCAGDCVPGDRRCDGNNAQLCDSKGEWQSSKCSQSACVNGECTGECEPSVRRCDGNGVRICSPSGVLGAASPCKQSACVNGECVGDCEPGSGLCEGNDLRTCVAGGNWGQAVTCQNSACVAGACTGVCAPLDRQCQGNSIQTCDADGTWGALEACVDSACVAGACVGACVPGATACNGNSVQTCDGTGAWGPDTPCINSACASGSCTGVCAPGAHECASKTLQTCNASGQWQPSDNCATAALCQAGLASGSCVSPACAAGISVCDGATLKVCNADQTGYTTQLCHSTTACQAGIAKASCPGPELLDTAAVTYSAGLLVDTSNLFWMVGSEDWQHVFNSSLRKLPKAGGQAQVLPSVGLQSRICGGWTHDAQFIYWVEKATSPVLAKIDKKDGARTVLDSAACVTHSSGTVAWGGVAADQSNVYFSSLEYTIKKISKQGGSSTVVVNDYGNAGSLAVTSTHLFWIGLGSVNRVSLGGTDVVSLTPAIQPWYWLQTDSQYAYWEAADSGIVGRVPLSGGGSSMVFDSSDSYNTLAVPPVLFSGSFYYVSFSGLSSVSASGGAVTLLRDDLLSPLWALVAVDDNYFYLTSETGTQMSLHRLVR